MQSRRMDNITNDSESESSQFEKRIQAVANKKRVSIMDTEEKEEEKATRKEKPNKEKEDNKDRGWEDDHEKRMKLIGDKRAAFVWLYNQTAKHYEKWNNIFALVVLVGSYVFGTSGIPVLFSSNNCATIHGSLRYVILALQISTIIIGIIATVHRFLKYERKIAKVRWASGKNAALYDDIKRELGRIRTRRQEYETFYDRVMKVESQLRQEAPFIPGHIMEQYYKKMGQRALPYDVLYNEERIVIRNATPTKEEISQAKDAEVKNRVSALNEARGRAKNHSATGFKPLDDIIQGIRGPPDYDLNVVRRQSVAPALDKEKTNAYARLTNRQRYELEKYFLD